MKGFRKHMVASFHYWVMGAVAIAFVLAPITARPQSISAKRADPQRSGDARSDARTGEAAAPTALSLRHAIQLALSYNLTTLLAREVSAEARGRKVESLAGLLPNLSGTAYQANLTQNLAALGLYPGISPGLNPTFIGPFNNFDARPRLVQSLFNLSAIRQFQAGRSEVRLADLRERWARQTVTTATALAYLDALRADRAAEAAQVNLKLAQSLLALAQDQRRARIAAGVDVTRAETRVEEEEQVRLAQAQTAAQQARLQLQRTACLPPGSPPALTDSLRLVVEALPQVASAVAEAERNRIEIQIVGGQVRLNDYERSAAQAEQLPGRFKSRERNAPTREARIATAIGTKYLNGIVGGFEQGAGLGFGLELTTADKIPFVEFRATALGSTRFYRRFEAEAYLPKIIKDKLLNLKWEVI